MSSHSTFKDKLLIGLVFICMLIIVIIWLVVAPPEYLSGKQGDGFFDTVVTQFSNIIKKN